MVRDGEDPRNYALFATSEQLLKSAMALGRKVEEHCRKHPEDNEAFYRCLAEIRTDEHPANRPRVLPDAEHLLKGRGVRERCELAGGASSSRST